MQHTPIIGTLSKQTGVHVETIRYYERIGILPRRRAARAGIACTGRGTAGGCASSAARARWASTLKKSAPCSVADGGAACGEVRAVALDHLARIRAKIVDLRRVETAIVARCDGGGVPDCPILEVLSE